MLWLNKQPAPIKKSRSNFAYDSPSWDVSNGLRISTKTRLRVFIWWYPKVNIQTIVFLNIDEVETSVIVKIAKRLKHGYSQELQTLKATRERTLFHSVFFFASQVKLSQIRLPFSACPENGRIPGAIEQNVPSRKEIITVYEKDTMQITLSENKSTLTKRQIKRLS